MNRQSMGTIPVAGSDKAEETPLRSSLWSGGNLARLRPTRTHKFKDDMEVFSPLVDVQPITPSVDKLWDEHGGARKDLLIDKQSSSLFSSSRRFMLSQEGENDVHPIFDWKPSSASKQQDDSQPGSYPAASSITPPEAWGGERISDKLAQHQQSIKFPSRFATLASSSLATSFSGSQDVAPSTSSALKNLRQRNISESDTPLVVPEQVALSTTLSIGTQSLTGQSNFDTQGPTLSLPRRFSTYAERISATPAFSDGTSLSTSSPKTKKMGAETKEELLNSFLSRSDAVPAIESGTLSSTNGGISQPQRMSSQPDLQQGSSFTLQLFQRSLEETLAPIQKAFHNDMRNLHIEVLRQAHTQQMEYSSTLSLILENQAEMMRRLELMEIAVQQLRKSL